MKITKVETIVVTMPMIIEGSVMPKQGGKPRTVDARHCCRRLTITGHAPIVTLRNGPR